MRAECRARVVALVLAFGIVVPLGAQRPAPASSRSPFAEQIRRAAVFDASGNAPEPSRTVRISDERTAKRAAWIGAGVGAVALPLGGYLAFHDSDSGPPKAGGILLLAAIGGLLGWMVGYLIGKG